MRTLSPTWISTFFISSFSSRQHRTVHPSPHESQSYFPTWFPLTFEPLTFPFPPMLFLLQHFQTFPIAQHFLLSLVNIFYTICHSQKKAKNYFYSFMLYPPPSPPYSPNPSPPLLSLSYPSMLPSVVPALVYFLLMSLSLLHTHSLSLV